MGDPSLYETVETLKSLVDDLRNLIHGNAATRTGGLLAELDSQRAQIAALERKVDRMYRPTIWLWLAGFVCFAGATLLAIIAIVNIAADHNVFDIPPNLAAVLAAALALLSATLLIAGFGWLENGR
jgi:uncharacterized membrane protein YgcG